MKLFGLPDLWFIRKPMHLDNFLPKSFSWDDIYAEIVAGETGHAAIKTQFLGDVKIRNIVYSENYKADHWCVKGHIIYVLDGQLVIHHQAGDTHVLKPGMSYLVGDNSMAHLAETVAGATVLVID